MYRLFSIIIRRGSRKPARCKALMLAIAGWACSAMPVAAEAPNIAVSIKPLHALVAGVTEGVTTPTLILGSNQSPHDFSLRPSQARLLAKADMVILVNRKFETFLQKQPKGNLLEVSQAKGITLYPARNAQGEEEHIHGAIDYHIWLNPTYASHIVRYVADSLAIHDPAHAKQYAKNAQRMITELAALDKQVETKLAASGIHKNGAGHLLYHDAYQYFENRYTLPAAPVITHSPELHKGAKSMAALHHHLAAQPPRCIFSEPQFDAAAVTNLAQEYKAEIRILSPDGATFGDGKQAYFALIQDIAKNFAECAHHAKQ